MERNIGSRREHAKKRRRAVFEWIVFRLVALILTAVLLLATMPVAMAEEIEVLGYAVGKGKIIEEFRGSAWNRKLPKKEIMSELCAEKGIDPRNVLVVGDGRSEIAAGAELGCVTLSRLDLSARRAREIHRELRTNMIVENFRGVFQLLFAEESGAAD